MTPRRLAYVLNWIGVRLLMLAFLALALFS